MKKLLLFLLFPIANVCLAIPLSGSYTIGPTGSDYNSITLAIQDLTANGISGAVVFNINSGTYTGSYTLPTVAGVSPVNTITFQSATGNADEVILQRTSSYVFAIDGQYCRLRNLKFSVSSGSSTNKNAVLLASTSDNTIIANCKFDNGGFITSANYNSNESSKASNTYLILNGNNTTIDSNLFMTCGSAMYKSPSASFTYATDIHITNNTFNGTFVNIVDLNRIRNLEFTGNQNSGTASYCTLKALSIGGSSLVSSNKLYTANADLPTGNNGIYLTGILSETCTLTVRNNFLATASHLSADNFTNVNIFNNSFKTAKSYCIALEDNSSLQHYYVYNNIFSGTVEYPDIRYMQSLPFSKVSMNNNAYGKEKMAVQYFTLNVDEAHYYDLQAWKAFASLDQNSPVVDEVYLSPTDLHTPNEVMLNGTGSAIPAVANDIDGEPRNAVPDIGADEFDIDSSTYRDLEIVNVFSPTTGCASNPFVLSVKNNSPFAITTFNIECSLNEFRGNIASYSQTINAGQTVQVTLNSCEIIKNTFYDKFDFYISQPNGLLDNNYANNKISISNVFQLGSFQILDESNVCNTQHVLYVPKVSHTTILWSTNETTNRITATQPGTYTATLTGDNGCSISQTININ